MALPHTCCLGYFYPYCCCKPYLVVLVVLLVDAVDDGVVHRPAVQIVQLHDHQQLQTDTDRP